MKNGELLEIENAIRSKADGRDMRLLLDFLAEKVGRDCAKSVVDHGEYYGKSLAWSIGERFSSHILDSYSRHKN